MDSVYSALTTSNLTQVDDSNTAGKFNFWFNKLKSDFLYKLVYSIKKKQRQFFTRNIFRKCQNFTNLKRSIIINWRTVALSKKYFRQKSKTTEFPIKMFAAVSAEIFPFTRYTTVNVFSTRRSVIYKWSRYPPQKSSCAFCCRHFLLSLGSYGRVFYASKWPKWFTMLQLKILFVVRRLCRQN